MATRDPKPTLTAHKNFNAEHDSEKLRKAMKGLGTDEAAVISVICERSHQQLAEIKKTYQQMFGRILLDDIKSELSGNFEKVVRDRFFSPVEYDAYILHEAVAGAGTKEQAIIEIMCTRENREIQQIKETYKALYKKDLMQDLIGDTSGDFKRLLVSMSAGERDTVKDNHALADEDAKKLFDAGQGRVGTDEEAFNVVFARRSWEQLKLTFDKYKQKYDKKNGIFGAINNDFSGDMREAYWAIATTAEEGREAYFAEKLYQSMKGAGTNDDQLIRLIVSRCEQDLATVKVHFLKKYKKTLEDYIKDDTSGDYKNALLKLSLGNH